MSDLSQAKTVLEFISKISFLGIYFFAVIANFLPGIPEEVFFFALGYGISEKIINFPYIVVFVFLLFGLLTTDSFLFFASRKGASWARVLEKKILKKRNFLENIENLRPYIFRIIFWSRFLMFIRFIGPVSAGILKVDYKKFIIIDALALIIYLPIVLFLGAFFGSQIESVIKGFSVLEAVIKIIVLIIISVFVIIKSRKWIFKILNKNVE